MGGEEKQAYFSIRVCRRIVITEMPQAMESKAERALGEIHADVPEDYLTALAIDPSTVTRSKNEELKKDVLLCETLVKKFGVYAP